MKEIEAETLISKEEAAVRLGVSLSSVQRMIKRGELSTRRVGLKSLNIVAADVEAIISGKAVA